MVSKGLIHRLEITINGYQLDIYSICIYGVIYRILQWVLLIWVVVDLKNMSSSIGMIIPDILQNKNHVPVTTNQQYLKNMLHTWTAYSIDWFTGQITGKSHDLYGKIWLVSG